MDINRDEHITPMLAGALHIREVYETLVHSGFSDEQAIYLTGKMVEGVLANA